MMLAAASYFGVTGQSAVRMTISRGPDSIGALVLRSRASLTGMRFHNPSRTRSEKRTASSHASLSDNAPARMRATKCGMERGEGP